MISDWTIYGYVGEGEVLCPDCYGDAVPIDTPFTRGDLPAPDTGWHGLLSIADTSEEGLNCGRCGEYIFEPSAAYVHETYGHAEYVRHCDLCIALEAQADTWAAEHEAGEHRDAPILGPRTVRNGWGETVTPAGCPDCERANAPADGQLALSSAAEHHRTVVHVCPAEWCPACRALES